MRELADEVLLEQWMPRMFEWSNDAIVLLDRRYRIVGANAAAERLYRHRLADVVGHELTEFALPARRAKLQRIRTLVEQQFVDGSAPGSGTPFRFEWTLGEGVDHARRLSMTVSGIRDGQGRLLGYGVVAQDVTAERRAERWQRALARLSSTALELNEVGEVFDAAVSIPTSLLGADHVTLFELAPGHRELVPIAQSGWPRPELLRGFRIAVWPGSALDELLTSGQPTVLVGPREIRGEEIPEVVGAMGLYLGAGVNVAVNVRNEAWGVLCASWGRKRSVHPNEIDLLQTVANVVATVIERKHNGELRLQHERMLRLGALGQMAAGVAHDLANVLAGIEAVVAAEDARGAPDGPRAPSVSDGPGSLERIRAEAQLGHQIVEDILAFARQAPLHPEPVDLGRWLIAQAPALRSSLGDRVDLVIEASEGDGPTVEADVCGLRRVLDNLVANGVEAIDGSGTVTVRLSEEPLGPADVAVGSGFLTGRWARLDVCDDGAGIDAAALPRIFEPFFTTKKHRRGTGLGLAQVHGLTLQHGGQVTVTSRPGEGTTFSVWLPLAE